MTVASIFEGSDGFGVRRTLRVQGRAYGIYDLRRAEARFPALKRAPVSVRILIENILRHSRDAHADAPQIEALLAGGAAAANTSFSWRPARILSQDLAGIPLIVDLAGLRDAVGAAGGDAGAVNPVIPVDLVVDHSLVVDSAGQADSRQRNERLEHERNAERFAMLQWAAEAFDNFRVVPPGKGICHQINLEHLASVVAAAEAADGAIAFPDTVLGTDSHTTMVNGVGVLGWGCGGTEAELAMLGEPVAMSIPKVVGVRLTGQSTAGVVATDIVLTVTQALRRVGVVGCFVEFFGPGLRELGAADRATIANMAPDYGATCAYFPIDEITLDYLRETGREPERIALVEAYAEAQGLTADAAREIDFDQVVEIDLSRIEPCVAGPRRPQERTPLKDLPARFAADFVDAAAPDDEDASVRDGDVLIAAITSCTNTSNARALVTAGLLARNAHRRGMAVPAHVKTSLSPGSRAVSDYLEAGGLQAHLDALGFQVVGYGCATCIGNSGPLTATIARDLRRSRRVGVAVLSGNRNFEGRINPDIRASYIAAPHLVVAYALAGTVRLDLTTEAIGIDREGREVRLQELMPTAGEVDSYLAAFISPEIYAARRAGLLEAEGRWATLKTPAGLHFGWDPSSSFIARPPYFDLAAPDPHVEGARVLLQVGDGLTTDHISPAGVIVPESAAADHLSGLGVAPADHGSYGVRRGHHDVMMRGAFSHPRLRNELVPDRAGMARHAPSGETLRIYDCAARYQAEGTPLVVVAGADYGTGSSRDWAAKGTRLLGVRAVIAESFERIHRANLAAMAVAPLQLVAATGRRGLALTGDESFDFDLTGVTPGASVAVTIRRADGSRQVVETIARLENETEIAYLRAGGILPYARGRLTGEATQASRIGA